MARRLAIEHLRMMIYGKKPGERTSRVPSIPLGPMGYHQAGSPAMNHKAPTVFAPLNVRKRIYDKLIKQVKTPTGMKIPGTLN